MKFNAGLDVNEMTQMNENAFEPGLNGGSNEAQRKARRPRNDANMLRGKQTRRKQTTVRWN